MHCAMCEVDLTPKQATEYKPNPDKEDTVKVCKAKRLCIMRYTMNATNEQLGWLHEDMLGTVDLHV